MSRFAEMDLQQIAQEFATLHDVPVFPVKIDEDGKKVPLVTAWNRSASKDTSSFGKLWEKADAYGVLPVGYTIFDFDSRAALVDFASRFRDMVVDTMLVHTPRGTHMWFKGETRNKNALRTNLDIRSGTAGYIIGPGSYNPLLGKGWHAKDDDLGIGDLPARLRDFVMDEQKPDKANTQLEASLWSEAPRGRNETLAAYKGHCMGTLGMTEAQANEMVRVANAQFDEPLSESELESTVLRDKDYEIAFKFNVAPRLTMLELRNWDGVLNMPPPAYVIDQVWPEGGVNVLYGPPGCGKSFLALDWSLHRAAGLEWFERRVLPAVNRETGELLAGGGTKVLYLAAEGAAGVGVRLKAWAAARGPSEATMERIRANWWLYPGALNLTKEDDINKLAEFIAENGFGLVIVDTLRKSMTGGDENSTIDVGKLMSALEGISVQLGCDSLVVHHGNKGEAGNYRGSSAIEGDAYNMWKLKPASANGTGHTMLAKLTTHKFKDAPEVELELAMDAFGESLAVVEATDLKHLAGQLAMDLQAYRPAEDASSWEERIEHYFEWLKSKDRRPTAKSSADKIFAEVYDCGPAAKQPGALRGAWSEAYKVHFGGGH